jgi:hypothetical protein
MYKNSNNSHHFVDISVIRYKKDTFPIVNIFITLKIDKNLKTQYIIVQLRSTLVDTCMNK